MAEQDHRLVKGHRGMACSNTCTLRAVLTALVQKDYSRFGPESTNEWSCCLLRLGRELVAGLGQNQEFSFACSV